MSNQQEYNEKGCLENALIKEELQKGDDFAEEIHNQKPV